MTTHSTLTPSALAGLEEKLKAATGPDREFDARLHILMLGQGGFDSELRHSIFSRNIDEWARTGHIAKVADNYGIPAYTASIDSALALVERVLPDCNGKIMWNFRQIGSGYAELNGPNPKWNDPNCPADELVKHSYCASSYEDRDGNEDGADSPARPIAIALLLALVRSLAAQQGERG